MENQTETGKLKKDSAFRKLNLSRRNSVSFGDFDKLKNEKTEKSDLRQTKSANIYEDRLNNPNIKQSKQDQLNGFKEFGAKHLKERRTSLPRVTIGISNEKTTELQAEFSDFEKAEDFCKTLKEIAEVHNSVSNVGDSGCEISINVDTHKVEEFNKSLKQVTAPILAINKRIEELEHEMKSLKNKSLFAKYWYGYELKKQKITGLEKLKDRILTDSSKTAGQHCQAIRKETQHRLLNYGFFSRRTWAMLNTIENDERALLSPRKL